MTHKDLFLQKLTGIKTQLSPEAALLIVSKNRTPEEIKAYYELGHRDFGENRVQELSEKSELLKESCPDIRWHMIGHLQTNKVNALFKVSQLYAIHSVHDLNLVKKLCQAEKNLTHDLQIFLQVNTSKEVEKSGFETLQELKEAGEILKSSSKLKLAGLMTMGTLRTDNFEDEARRCFQELNSIKEELQVAFQQELKTSMGMSQDYEIALNEKSNWIRLGTVMFK